jgi:hypothetical protein
VRIELLYFDGCPNHEALLSRLRAVLAHEGIEERVELHRVQSLKDAERDRFLGSPTVRIDGGDVEPGALARGDFGLKCRLYRSKQGISGLPSDEWIVDAIRSRVGE